MAHHDWGTSLNIRNGGYRQRTSIINFYQPPTHATARHHTHIKVMSGYLASYERSLFIPIL